MKLYRLQYLKTNELITLKEILLNFGIVCKRRSIFMNGLKDIDNISSPLTSGYIVLIWFTYKSDKNERIYVTKIL